MERSSAGVADPTDFDGWVLTVEPRLRQSLVSLYGVTVGVDATADALAFAWENWERVAARPNPAGYIFGVGRNYGRKAVKPGVVDLPPVVPHRTPMVEPGLPDAVASLPEQQRIVVTLLYGFEWTMTEVSELLGIAKTTVQNHAERGLQRLRAELGVAR